MVFAIILELFLLFLQLFQDYFYCFCKKSGIVPMVFAINACVILEIYAIQTRQLQQGAAFRNAL